MARDKSPAFQFYADSWLSSKDILLMTPSEEGAYIRLLAIAWLEPDCGLPDNDPELAVLSRLGKEWDGRSREKIRAKFRAEGGRLYNDRLLEERRKQAEWSRKSSAGGKKSAEARARKSGPVQLPLGPTSSPPPASAGPPNARTNPRLIEAFHEWIAEYPNPVRIDTALQAWISLIALGEITDETMPDVFAGLRRWKIWLGPLHDGCIARAVPLRVTSGIVLWDRNFPISGREVGFCRDGEVELVAEHEE